MLILDTYTQGEFMCCRAGGHDHGVCVFESTGMEPERGLAKPEIYAIPRVWEAFHICCEMLSLTVCGQSEQLGMELVEFRHFVVPLRLHMKVDTNCFLRGASLGR